MSNTFLKKSKKSYIYREMKRNSQTVEEVIPRLKAIVRAGIYNDLFLSHSNLATSIEIVLIESAHSPN